MKMNKKNIFLRTFFLQALWNFERLQNIGFLYILYPTLKKLYPNKEKRKEVLLRHIGFFNTNPYMATVIVAMVLNAEKEISVEKEKNLKKPEIIKTLMAGPVAAIGDYFFWGTLRPVVSFITILLIILSLDLFDVGYLWIPPIAFIFLYNIVHLSFRYWSLMVSFRLDDKMIKMVSKLEIKYIGDTFRVFGLVVIALAIFFYFKTFGMVPVIDLELHKLVYPDVLLYGVIFLLSFLLGRVKPVVMFYFAIIFSFILGYLGI